MYKTVALVALLAVSVTAATSGPTIGKGGPVAQPTAQPTIAGKSSKSKSAKAAKSSKMAK